MQISHECIILIWISHNILIINVLFKMREGLNIINIISVFEITENMCSWQGWDQKVALDFFAKRPGLRSGSFAAVFCPQIRSRPF